MNVSLGAPKLLIRGLMAAVAMCFALAAQSQTQPQARPAQRCDALKGLEKSECERRDTAADDAPTATTPAMREKEEKAREETTSAADPESDTAGTRKPRTAAASPTESEKEPLDESTKRQPRNESDTESDSLERPRRE